MIQFMILSDRKQPGNVARRGGEQNRKEELQMELFGLINMFVVLIVVMVSLMTSNFMMIQNIKLYTLNVQC